MPIQFDATKIKECLEQIIEVHAAMKPTTDLGKALKGKLGEAVFMFTVEIEKIEKPK